MSINELSRTILRRAESFLGHASAFLSSASESAVFSGRPLLIFYGVIAMTNNKDLVLKAFDTLFNKRDYDAAANFWSPSYIQHSAHIPPGRDGLFNLVRAAPPEMAYENHVAAADGDYVMLHGRFTNNGRPRAWIAGDVVRLANGVLVEHWDTLQDEVAREDS